MNENYTRMLEQIIKMQSYAGQQPVKHAELLNRLYQLRAELERLSTEG